MAADSVVDGDYLGAYSRFFADFIARVNPHDQLPVKVSAYDINEGELVGEIIRVTLQYLNQTECPPSLQSYIVHLVIQAIKSTCKKQPEICGLRQPEKTYAPLKLMQAVTNEVNEICRRYLDNSRLALLPPPSSTPQVSMGATRNVRRKMEDRHVVLHDLHTIFNIQDNTIANYYAVFDGHGGQDAAAYCATHLHRYLVESVHYPTDPESALRDAFLTTDAQFIAKSNTQKLNGGTTAVCALILNKKLYIAWVGDSMASLVTRNQVKQLVNPHRPTREDETKRIIDLGGVVVHCMGVLRVNGLLSISRAIGDVSYKPYISGEPEVRCVSLNGTEDFLIIACDGLWDYVDQKSAAQLVYRQVLQNPHDLKYVQQALLHSAKYSGSLDNITVIVVFLTPPIEIALRHQPQTHQAPNGLLLNNIRMDPNNPISSNSSESDADDYKPMFVNTSMECPVYNKDIQSVIFGEATRNGKMDGGEDYDYVDLGPETDVDATDDPPLATSSSRELSPESEKLSEKTEERSNDNNDRNRICDDADVDEKMDSNVDDHVESSDRNIRGADNETLRDTGDDTRVESTGTHTVVEDDESPSLPQAARTPQDALIPEAENVADSEDSEDEWNYYSADPKTESATAATVADESHKEEEQSVQENPESVTEDSSEIQSSKVHSSGVEDYIKCETIEKSSSELVSIDTSDEGKRSESEQSYVLLEAEKQEQDNKGDMDFQLNPEAAEFVPSSPPLLGNRSFLQDYPISGSPLKQTPAMDDIPVPSQREFEEEVCHRPREIDEHFSSDEQHTVDHAVADSHRDNICGMDESEVSSTKAEMGDDSMMGIMSTTQWQTDVSSQWGGKTRDDSEDCDLEEYDIVNKSDLMAMSFTAGNLETAFEKGVDLNAVHDLNESSDGAEHADTLPRSPEEASEERIHTPSLEDKGEINLLCVSSTPYPTDGKLESTTISKSNETEDAFSAFKADGLSTEQPGISDLVAPTEHVIESTEHVIESTEHVIESMEHVKESTEHVTESTERVTESTERVTESTERVTESTEHVTESTGHVTESTGHVTESTEHVIESTISNELKSISDESKHISDELKCDQDSVVSSERNVSNDLLQANEGQIDNNPQLAENQIKADDKETHVSSSESELYLTNSLCVDTSVHEPEESIKLDTTEEIDEENIQKEEIETATQNKPEASLFDSTWNTLENRYKERQEFAEKTAMSYVSDWKYPTSEKSPDDENFVSKTCSDAQKRLLLDGEPIVVPDTLIETSIHLPIEHSESHHESMNWTYNYKDDRPLLPSKENYPKFSCFAMRDESAMNKEDKSRGEADSSEVDRDPFDGQTKLIEEFPSKEDSPKLSSLMMHDEPDKESKSAGEIDSSKVVQESFDGQEKLDDPEFHEKVLQTLDQEQQDRLEKINIAPSENALLLNSETEREQTEEKIQEEAKITSTNISQVFDQYMNSKYDALMTEITGKDSESQKSAAVLSESIAKEDKPQEVATTAVVTAVSPTKTKTTTTTTTTTTTAKRPRTITKATSPTTKTATKSTPTSPSKLVGTVRTTTQSTAAKKSAAARPKQLDGSKTVASSVGGTKQTAMKTTTTTTKTAITTATKTSISPRIGTMKPKTVAATSPKPSGLSIEKKLTANGDTKSLSKPLSTKPAVSKTTSTTKTTLSPSMSAKPPMSGVILRTKPLSATSTAKPPPSMMKQSTTSGTTSVSKLKTASSLGTTKPRESIKKATSMKSPDDKQNKETSNKLSQNPKVSGVSLTKLITRTKPTGITGTAITAKPRTLLGKSALSPTKKSLTPKNRSRTDADTKSISSSEAKQNGVPQMMKEVNDKIIERLNGSEDEIPQKDTSPVNVTSTDNQLVVD